jgi:hypothetical protein
VADGLDLPAVREVIKRRTPDLRTRAEVPTSKGSKSLCFFWREAALVVAMASVMLR